MRGYLLVAVLGFALGTLCAQKKGAVLRKELKDSFCDLQRNGTEALELLQRKSREIVDKATPAVSQAKEEAKILQCEGEEVVRITSASLQVAYEKGQSALQKAHERIADKAAPAIAQVKEEAKGLRDGTTSVFKKAADSIKDKALATMEQMERKCKELIGKTSSTTDAQKLKVTQAGKGCMEVVKAPGSPLYEVREGRAATQ